jgi:RNA polymerase sigma-70 factor (ECF subfamily)
MFASMAEMQSVSDAVLMVAIGRWNEAALAEAYRRHGTVVHGLACRLLGEDSRAEDVTQEVFVELWNRPQRFDPERGSLRAFLLTMAHGRAIDLLRADTARQGRERRTAPPAGAAGFDVEGLIWDRAVAQQLKEAVGALPKRERRAIELAYFGGHTYREVAILMGEPEGTVKSRIRAGLRHLRAALAQGGMEPTWTDR